MTPPPDPSDVARVRTAFIDADYTAEGVLGLLGTMANGALARREGVPARRVLRSEGPTGLSTLIRLFLLGDAVSAGEAASALPLDAACRLGLVAPEPDGGIRARLDARPYDEAYYVVSDLGAALDGAARALPADYVLGVGGASVALTGLTVPESIGRALDLGTGCGVQALHLRARADHVVATDILPRALDLARLGAALSDVELDLRLGGLYEPVEGERFDLIVSNPPFVVGAGAGAGGQVRAYRDGGLAGDEFCRRLVEQAPEHLNDGGWCQVLANWVHVRGEDWTERVSSWLPPGCDAWALQREVLDPAAYVSLWLRDAGDVVGPRYPVAYDAWMDALERDRVEAIGFGWITVRRSGVAAPHVRIEDWPHAVDAPLGPHIADAFHRTAWLRDRTDEALADARLRLADGVIQELVGRPGADDPEHVVLRQRYGLRRARLADTSVAALVGACDGTVALGPLIDAVASVLGEEPAWLREQLIPLTRDLVRDGYLEPA